MQLKKNNQTIILITILILCNILNLKLCNAQEAMKQSTNQNTNLIKEFNGIKEYRMPNRIKILLKENHSIPLITFSIWYKVGSRNESQGEHGLAHFLEHMMFKGTKKYKKGQISETIQNLGGVYNAFTSSDGTAYYETILPEHLEKVLDIESDRMKNSALEEKELNLERNVVLSEFEGDLNNPATYLDFKVRDLAYDISPYKHPTIGNEKDIKNTTHERMHRFYKKYYSPSNSTIVLTGDFNEKNALKLINKYFGCIEPNKQSLQDNIPKESLQTKQKRITVKRTAASKLIEIAFHISEVNNLDIYPLNIIEEYLLKGNKSPLEKKLVDTGLATEVGGGAEASRDPGLFQIVVSLTPKTSHKKVEKIIFNELEKIINKPINLENLNAAKNRIKANYLFNLDGTYNTALNIGYFELIHNWEESQRWINEINNVTQEDAIKAAKKYLTAKNSTVGYFKPLMQKGEKYKPDPITLSRTQSYKKENTNLISKSIQGINGFPAKLFSYKKQSLNDGSTLLKYDKIDQPVTYITGIVKGGSSLLDKSDEIYCQIISMTLDKGSKNYSKEDIEDILDRTGSHIDFSCDEESFRFSLATTNDNLQESVKLLLDLLINPTFPKNEIEREKKKFTAELNELKDNTNELAVRRFNQLIYSKDHPYYSNTLEEDIKNLKKTDYKKLSSIHNKLIRTKTSLISLISNLNDNEFKVLIETLNSGLNIGTKKIIGESNIPDTKISDTPRFESIFVKDKYQSDIYLGHAGNLLRTDPDFYKINIANYILGGSSLSSRLSKTVRDSAGLTYTIYSYISSSLGKGEFGIYFGSNNKNVDKALEHTKEEIQRFVKTGITAEELAKAKKSLISSFVSRNLATYKKIASTIASIEYFNLGENYIDNYPKIINSITLKEVNSILNKYYFPDKLNIVVAGEYKKPEE